jgi:hypothetical protein
MAFITAQTECKKTTLAGALDPYSREITPHKNAAALAWAQARVYTTL